MPDFHTAPSEETRAFNAALEMALKNAPPIWSYPIALIRQIRANGEGILPISGPLQDVLWRSIPNGQRARFIEAENARGLYVHIHGGGWTFGGADQCDGRNKRLSAATGFDVMSLEYRFGPENRWPACADDCFAGAVAAIEHAQSKGYPVFIGGESAGGHLTAVTLARLKSAGLIDQIAGTVMIYGCFDLRMTPSMKNWGDRLLVLSTPVVDWFSKNLLGDDLQGADTPEVSPLLGDLEGMPPAYFQVGDLDPLLDDSLFMAARWRAAGASADLTVWPGGVHAFDVFDQPIHNLPIALESQAATATWLKGRIEAP